MSEQLAELTDPEGSSAGHGEPHSHGDHHIIPTRTYWIVIAWLMVLLIVTLGAAMADLGALNLPIAMAIAVVKAVLVVLYFMHVKFSTRLVKFFAMAALIWLLIMFVLTLQDYLFRGRFGALS